MTPHEGDAAPAAWQPSAFRDAPAAPARTSYGQERALTAADGTEQAPTREQAPEPRQPAPMPQAPGRRQPMDGEDQPGSVAAYTRWLSHRRYSRPVYRYTALSRRDGRVLPARALGHLRSLVVADTPPERLTRAWSGAQAPVSTGRRVLVVGAHGGAGTSTVAVCLAQELQARRADGVALVDAAPGRAGLRDRLRQPPDGDVETAAADSRRSADLRVYAPAPRDPSLAEQLATSLRRVASIVITDHGCAVPRAPGSTGALVVVAHCSVQGVGTAVAAVQEAQQSGWERQRVLVVLTQVPRSSGVSSAQALAELRRLRIPALLLRHDRHLAGAAQVAASRLAPATQLQLAELAAAVVRAAVSGGAATGAGGGTELPGSGSHR